jgi:hypothetical protein
MRIYMDSSAFAKRYIEEPGTARVRALLELADEVLLSMLTLPEVAGALNRLRREGRLTDADYLGCKQRLLADLEGASVIAITPAILSSAVRCLERAPLRAADAVHVAAALEADPDQFVSSDHRQCEAARGMGLRVEEIVGDE